MPVLSMDAWKHTALPIPSSWKPLKRRMDLSLIGKETAVGPAISLFPTRGSRGTKGQRDKGRRHKAGLRALCTSGPLHLWASGPLGLCTFGPFFSLDRKLRGNISYHKRHCCHRCVCLPVYADALRGRRGTHSGKSVDQNRAGASARSCP